MDKLTITNDEIVSIVAKEEYVRVGIKTTICCLTLKNGFEIVGESACVDPANFDVGLGRKYARERAINKIWELEGYRLQCELHKQ